VFGMLLKRLVRIQPTTPRSLAGGFSSRAALPRYP